MFQIFQLRFILLSTLLMFLLTPLCHADYAQPAEKNESTFIDKTHRGISTSLSAPSQWFDSFFSHPSTDEEPEQPAGTFLRLRGSSIAEEGEKLSFKGQLKARLRLPNLKQRFHLIFSSEDDDLRDETLKDARVDRELADKDEENSLALQYTQKRSAEFSLTHRVGLDLDDGLNPHVRSRIRYSIPVAGESLLSFAQAIFWENNDGFGEETRLDYDIPVKEQSLIRATGNGLFSESSNGYQWLSMLQYLQSFSHKKALAFGGYTAGETRPQNHVTEYDVFIKYRQKIIKKWLFVEMKPEVKWAREKNFKAASIFTLTLEVQFND